MQRVRLLLLMMAAAAAATSWRDTAEASFADGDDGVDRVGGDLAGMPLTLEEEAAKASDCAALCEAREGCAAWAFGKAFCGTELRPKCWLKGNVPGQSLDRCRVSGVRDAALLPFAFAPLPLAAAMPTGWLQEQLRVQARGLSGHLSLFWADIEQSTWVGGHHDGAALLHERAPYWLNGAVPLAFQLTPGCAERATMLSQVSRYIDFILAHQQADGWLGADNISSGNKYWGSFNVLQALTQYAEAAPEDARVVPALLRFLRCVHARLFATPLGNTWSGARWMDLVLTAHWLLDNRADDPAVAAEMQFLWDLGELLHAQGFDWRAWFEGPSFPEGPTVGTSLFTHGVNNAQALKSSAVYFRQSRDPLDRASSLQRVERLMRYHGQPTGMFGCDEHLAGRMPSRGSELCTVVEAMFSYTCMSAVHGETAFADLAERIAYNALPGTLDATMWSHQYLQQANEVDARAHLDHVWTHDGPDATLFGLAPNFGCCTANFNQGWPKLAARLWLRTGDGGLLAHIYGPSAVRAGDVSVNASTDYPFDNVVRFAASSAAGFPLHLRIPAWATNDTSVTLNGAPLRHLTLRPGTVAVVALPPGRANVTLTLGAALRTERGMNGAVSVHYGPLLFALHLAETWTKLRQYAFQSADWEITTNTSWAVALDVDSLRLERGGGGGGGGSPFAPGAVPLRVLAKGRSIADQWKLEHNAPAAPPQSPVKSAAPLQDLVFLPYGATELRMAELPVLDTAAATRP